jgi:hypothetical protein
LQGGQSFLLPVGKRYLKHVARADLALEVLRRVQYQQLAIVNDADSIGQAVRFIHVMRGENDGRLLSERSDVLSH